MVEVDELYLQGKSDLRNISGLSIHKRAKNYEEESQQGGTTHLTEQTQVAEAAETEKHSLLCEAAQDDIIEGRNELPNTCVGDTPALWDIPHEQDM